MSKERQSSVAIYLEAGYGPGMFKSQLTREGHNTDAFGEGTELWSLGASHLCVLMAGGWASHQLSFFWKMETGTFEKIKSDAARMQSILHSACRTGPLLERWHHCPDTCHLDRVGGVCKAHSKSERPKQELPVLLSTEQISSDGWDDLNNGAVPYMFPIKGYAIQNVDTGTDKH